MTFELDPVLTVELIKEGLAQGKFPYATVTSDSMSPLLLPGDEVQIAPANPASLKPGTVILLAKPDGLLAHRYWQTCDLPEGAYFITRGDRLPEFDPPTTDDCLVGQLIARRRDSRQLSLTNGSGGWLNRQLASISRWDAALRKTEIGDEEIGNKIPGRNRHRQQNVAARIARRFLYILAVILTTLVNATAKS